MTTRGLVSPTHRSVRRYYETLEALKSQSVDNEMSVRPAFELLLTETAKMSGNMHAADYMHVFLGLISINYVSDSFHKHYEKLKKEPHAYAEGPPLVALASSFPRVRRHIAPIPTRQIGIAMTVFLVVTIFSQTCSPRS
ncbi:MAG: hypothetical protein ACLQVM_27975 [Terriglobia bacterium]